MFETRLAEAGLSEEDYRQLKGFFDTIEADRSRVEAYRRKIAAAEDAAVKAVALVAGLERPDVAALEIGRHEAEQRMRAAVESRTGAEHLLNQRIRLRDELVYALQKLDAAEAASGPLRNLAALVNGDNPQKLDLETFAIGAMFDQVLAAANIRLGPMTSHRYRLERDVEGGGRGRRGLGIQAFDSHTARRARRRRSRAEKPSLPRWRWRWAWPTSSKAPPARCASTRSSSTKDLAVSTPKTAPERSISFCRSSVPSSARTAPSV